MSAVTIGPEIVIPDFTVNIQYRPQIVALENGNFLISWADGSGRGPDGEVLEVTSGFARHAQIFDANGTTIGDAFLVHDSDQKVSPLNQHPIFATSDGGAIVLRYEDDMVRIRKFSAAGVQQADSFIDPLNAITGDAEFLDFFAGEVPGQVLVMSQVDDVDPGPIPYLGYSRFIQIIEPNGQVSPLTIDIGFSISSTPPTVFMDGNVIYTMRSTVNQYGKFDFKAFDATTGVMISENTIDFIAMDLGDDDYEVHNFEMSHVADGKLIIAAVQTGIDSNYDLDFEASVVVTLNATTLGFDAISITNTVDTPGLYTPNASFIIELPFGQKFAVFADYDTFKGQLLNADLSLNGGSFDMSVQNGFWHLAVDGAYVGDGRVVVVWDYSGGVGYEDPVMRSYDLSYDGNDVLFGAKGRDIITAGLGNDTVLGGDGKDLIRGQSGRDDLQGGAGKDRLIGSKGKDKLSGDAGNDILDGGKGNDILRGGSGSDTFYFDANRQAGSDRIIDFEDGLDMIRIRGGSFEALTFATQGDHVLVTWANGDVLIRDVDLVAITADDFSFL